MSPTKAIFRAAVFGGGKIAQHLIEELHRLGWRVAWYARQSGLYKPKPGKDTEEPFAATADFVEHLSGVDVAFVAISTLDEGEAEHAIILECLKQKIPVVTCAKGALSSFPDLWEPDHIEHIGLGASVGGGTGIPDFVRQHFHPRLRLVHAVVNGTLMFVIDQLQKGKKIADAIDSAVKAGYSEPGEVDPLAVINAEALGDVPRKTAILLRLLGTHDIDPERWIKSPATEHDLQKLAGCPREFRFIVTFSQHEVCYDPGECFGGFHATMGGWNVVAGFRRWTIDSRMRTFGDLRSVQNAVIMVQDAQTVPHVKVGFGAGSQPTVAQMIADAQSLLQPSAQKRRIGRMYQSKKPVNVR